MELCKLNDDFKDKFPQNLLFLLVTCYIRYNLLQEPTEKENNFLRLKENVRLQNKKHK